MGAFLYMGICRKLRLQRLPEAMPEDELLACVERLVDPALCERTDGEGEVQFSLPDSFVEEHLVSFLEKQYASMQVEESRTGPILLAVREAISRHQLCEYADARRSAYFSTGRPRGSFWVGRFGTHKIPYVADTLTYFCEGKIFMEEDGVLISYLQSLVRAQGDQCPLARAACAYIE